MTHVNVTIHGRQYRMACEDGQEDHLVRLAKDLDQRIEQLQRADLFPADERGKLGRGLVVQLIHWGDSSAAGARS